MDTWTGRRVERVPLTNEALARARAFVDADHPALQTVLRIDRETSSLWLEAPRGTRVERSLTPVERRRLEDALEALAGAGGRHGRVDREHVIVTGDGVLLRFGTGDPGPTDGDDRAALARF
jgi:hypothetical protein